MTTTPGTATILPVDATAGTPGPDEDTAELPGGYRWSRYAWRYLDREQARQLWSDLVDWVSWLRTRYQLGHDIPPCWFRHAAMVEELTALMCAHRAAYTLSPTQIERDRDDLAAWHRHWLWPMIDRFPALSPTSRCSDTDCGHHPRTPATLDTLPEFLAADLDTRPEGEPDTDISTPRTRSRSTTPVVYVHPLRAVTTPPSGLPRGDVGYLTQAAMDAHRAAGRAHELPDPDHRGRPRIRLGDTVWVRSHAAGGWLRAHPTDATDNGPPEPEAS